jgi:phosphohistidine phosphatase
MRQLILLRHAKAVPQDEAEEDFDRALAAEGREAAPRVAAALARAGAAPDIVLVSDAARTRETWELVKRSFPSATKRFLKSLYLCPAETLMTEAERTKADSVMLVGHNPGLHDLASRLAYRNDEMDIRLRAKFPPGAGAIFGRKDEMSSWRLQGFVTPKDA